MGMSMSGMGGSVYGPGPVAAAASVLIPPSPGGQAGMSGSSYTLLLSYLLLGISDTGLDIGERGHFAFCIWHYADGQDHTMPSPLCPMLDIQLLVFELPPSAWS